MSNERKMRKKRTAEEKLAILKRHLVKGEKVSAICDAEGIAPSQFYSWQQALFENGAQALERKGKNKAHKEAQVVQELRSQLDKTKAKLSAKHEVLSELMSEHIMLKKSLGD